MAEAISVGFVLLAAVSAGQKGYDLIHNIQDISPQVDQLNYKLKTQRRTFESWSNRMRQAVGNNLEFAVPAKDIKEVEEITQKLEEYLNIAERMYRKVDPEILKKRSQLSQLRARAEFVLQGSKRLERIVATLKVLNDYLENIALPPPPYDTPEVRARRAELFQTSRTSKNGEEISYSTSDINPKSQVKSIVRACAEIPKQSTNPMFEQYHVVPSAMFSLCLDTLSTAKNYKGNRKPYLENAFGRLKLWEVGLFEPSASLDVLISEDVPSGKCVRLMFLKCSAMLLAHLENILKYMYQQQSSLSIADALKRVNMAFEADDLKPFLVQQLQIAFEPEDLFEESVDLQDSSLRLQQDVESAKAVCRIVECFFELLPSIAILRENHWFGQNATRREKASNAGKTVERSNYDSTPLSEISEEDFEKIQSYLRKFDQERKRRQQPSSQQSSKITLYEPSFKREVKRLKELETLQPHQDAIESTSNAKKLITSLLEDIKSQDMTPNRSSEISLQLQIPWRASTFNSMSTFDSQRTLVDPKSKEDDIRFFIESLQRL